MKKSKLFYYFFVVFALISCQSHSYYHDYLKKMHNHKLSRALRKHFDFYTTINASDSVFKNNSVINAQQFSMIKEKFLVLDIEEDDDDFEYILYIAIYPKDKPKQIKAWRLMLKPSTFEESGYEIVDFAEYDFADKRGKKWPFSQEYAKYWL